MSTETEPAPTSEPTPVPFRAEVKQLLHILAHSLYTDREIFLRELISNASDALYRVQFEMLTNHDVLDPEAELAIRVTGDEQAKTVTITDTGIGMTREEMIENLGTIAQSGARALMERLESGQRGDIIGQFGVGFYSAFVVADEVTVISRSHKPDAEAALWRQAPRQVEAEKYPEFYRQLTMDFEAPLLHVHLSTDAPVDLHTILFVPGKRERGLIERRVEGKIKLYSRKVLIQEEAKDLLPNYYRFVEGVVDSEDLPLNVSREMVQSNPVLSKIKKTLTGRLTKELAELAEKDAEKYAAFWHEFGVFIKEGIATEMSARSDLLPLLRFHSTKSGDALASLADYKGRMLEGQDEIYYVMGSDLESTRRSPHLEALEERGLEALLFVDMMDGFMLNGLREYEGHKLRNVDDPNLTLPGEAKPSEVTVSDEQFARLVTTFKEQLGERITAVRASNVLRNSPARLVSPEDTPNREMERIQRILERDFKVPARLIELNRGHQLIADLARMIEERPGDPLIASLVEQIYESALLLEGLHPNPANMVERIQKLMEAAARQS